MEDLGSPFVETLPCLYVQSIFPAQLVALELGQVTYYWRSTKLTLGRNNLCYRIMFYTNSFDKF